MMKLGFFQILPLALLLSFVTATVSAADSSSEFLELLRRYDINQGEAAGDASIASGTPDAPIDIREAIDLMLRDNLSLKSLRQEIMKAEAARLTADGTMTPSVNLTAQTSVARPGEANRMARRAMGQDELVWTDQASISVNQTLYSGGRNTAMRRQAMHTMSIADLALIDAQNRAAGQLFAAFYNVLLAERRIEVEEAAVARAEMHFREVSRMSELGLTNRLEVIRASQQLATNRANQVTAMGNYDAAVISLMNILAIPPEERRPVAGTLRVITVRGDREQSLAAAMENRADLGIAENRIESQDYQIVIARSGARPNLTLGGAASVTDAGRTGNFDDTWSANLLLTVPVLDRNTTRANVINAEATAAQIRISAEEKRLEIKSGVETAWSELETATEHLEAATRALELAEETMRLAEVGYREGVTPQLDLLAAQMSLTESRLGFLRSLYNHKLAVVALKVTEGTIIDWAESTDF